MQYSHRFVPISYCLCLLLVWSLNAKILVAESAPTSAEQREFFESKIRPILSDQCESCHNSSDTAEGGLRLDSRTAFRKGGQSGSLFDFDSPDKSLLLKVIRHEIDKLEMPQGEDQLSAKVISDFEKWIGMGAPDPRNTPPETATNAIQIGWEATLQERKKWWSFQPIASPVIPIVKNKAWSKHPIDQFILAKLEENELQPSIIADRRSLIRRLSFVLLGLPPSPAEIDQFENDQSPDAYEKLVDKYLNDPAFGEHWARHWMDLVRYSETHGSEHDPRIPNAWKYRDYLIRAFNDDLPYDQFVVEHVAGDLLNEPRINPELKINESAIAPAHWRMCYHGFAPTDPLDEKVRFTDDQINVFSKTFLGVTISCARCHNHKFDPISQADYYAMFGVVGSTRPGIIDVNPKEIQDLHKPELTRLKSEIRKQMAEAWTASTDDLASRLHQKLSQVEQSELQSPQHLLYPFHQLKQGALSADIVKRNAKAHKLPEKSFRWNFNNPQDFEKWYTHGNGTAERIARPGEFTVPAEGQSISPLMPGGVYSHLLSTKHRNVFSSPHFELDGKYEVWIRVNGESQALLRYVVQNYPRNGTVYPVTSLTDGKWKWQRYDLSYWEGEVIHIELTTAADSAILAKDIDRSWFGVQEVVVAPVNTFQPPKDLPSYTAVLDSASVATIKTQADLIARYLSVLKHAISSWQNNSATDQQVALLQAFRQQEFIPEPNSPRLQELLQQYRKLESQVPVPNRVPGLLEADAENQPLFIRGNHRQPGASIPRRFLEAIDATPYQTEQSGRLQLAEHLINQSNPLTSRVIVNRLWHYLFGAGIVRTVDNFGRLGEEPSHPELLDYLALQMQRQGWSMKKMLREILLTRTWQLEAHSSARATEFDPENRFLSHANIRRLDAEAIRDSLLTMSGRLDRSLYGPPAGIATNHPRRSVYMSIRRNSLNPFLETFDAPVPFAPKGRRDATNVPAQSLTMLNDSFVISVANSMAKNLGAELTPQQRIQQVFEKSLGRKASPAELTATEAYVAQLEEQYRSDHEVRSQITSQIVDLESKVAAIVQQVRQQLESKTTKPQDPFKLIAPPLAEWKFDGTAKDSVGHLHGELKGNAKIVDGALILDGKSYLVSPPIDKNLLAKSFEVVVQIENFDQRGGGLLSVQDLSGIIFDSLVLGEQQPRHWLAGSNGFARTERFDGTAEDAKPNQSIHLVVTYGADGMIRCFRNGSPYGRAYRKSNPVQFQAGNSQVLIGLRHGQPSGNRLLTGKILEARLYDRSLSVEEVELLASQTHSVISKSSVRKAMSAEQLDIVNSANQQLETLKQRRKELGEPPQEDQAWADFAHAMFNLKEFIYIR